LTNRAQRAKIDVMAYIVGISSLTLEDDYAEERAKLADQRAELAKRESRWIRVIASRINYTRGVIAEFIAPRGWFDE
jgi:hypothetical protein